MKQILMWAYHNKMKVSKLKNSKVKNNEGKMQKNFKNYILKESIKKKHYVGSSILLMMEKMLKRKSFKS
jgi:hypothetical protein